MNDAYAAVLTKQLARLKRVILRDGPLTWAGARLAMNAGSYDRRDASFHNVTLMQWIAAGELKQIELENGDSLVG